MNKAIHATLTAARTTINLPVSAVAITYAINTGGSCYSRGSYYECDNVFSPSGRPFTMGNTVLNAGARADMKPALWQHETRHSNQWAIYGFGDPFRFVFLYGVDELYHGGFHSCGWFEQSAGCHRGGY
jgi:hypothetical protein